ncbi:MAG: endo alpha-1,4 polygalactosaminidase [Acidimicrobiales bacterium]
MSRLPYGHPVGLIGKHLRVLAWPLAAVLTSCAYLGRAPSGSPTAAPPPANAGFDYQLGGDYRPPRAVTVVSRDWFEGKALRGGYSICYVNAFQTQPDDDGSRPDERSRWPEDLVLSRLGDDPNWGGEYLVDLSTASKRTRASRWVRPMIDRCAQRGFDAVEFDNLDSWTRFDGTPLAGQVPFGPDEAARFAGMLTSYPHGEGLAVAQKNARQLLGRRRSLGFDFAVVEQCGEQSSAGDDECRAFAKVYGAHIVDIEYTDPGFGRACASIGRTTSVVRRDLDLTRPGSRHYVDASC